MYCGPGLLLVYFGFLVWLSMMWVCRFCCFGFRFTDLLALVGFYVCCGLVLLGHTALLHGVVLLLSLLRSGGLFV